MWSARRAFAAALALASSALPAFAGPGDSPRSLDRADYARRLRGMWLGELIANWTGLQYEGAFTNPPFMTDDNWSGAALPGPITYVLNQDPWRADDDTDVEYVYLHLLSQHHTTTLTADQIAAGWTTHINRMIWVSNWFARQLISRGVGPPATSFYPTNPGALMIDAQLTTEFFGALAPGMPEKALAMADLPIRVTAAGHACHAAQFYVVLYALATQVDRSLPPREQALWLVRQARQYLPDTSKAADIVDTVLADFLANPDAQNWERTRDLVADRYWTHAAQHGFVARNWFESSVNFAAGVTALLYGNMDLRRTIQIGTLFGWDCDNATATLGGLLGLILGENGVRAQFPEATLSSTFWISRTRDNLPNLLAPGTPPSDTVPVAEDSLQLMAERMLPIIDLAVAECGGLADAAAGRWLLPAAPLSTKRSLNPQQALSDRSANVRVRLQGGSVTGQCPTAMPPFTQPSAPAWLCLGVTHSNAGTEAITAYQQHYSCIDWARGTASPPGTPVTLGVLYDRPVEVHTIRFIEGDHPSTGDVGGWFQSITPQILVGGAWVTPAFTQPQPPDPARPFQIIDLVLAVPTMATGIRVTGPSGGGPGATIGYVTCIELDALASPAPPPARASFDRDGDGLSTIEDAYFFATSPIDLDGDDQPSPADARFLESRLRWLETRSMATQR